LLLRSRLRRRSPSSSPSSLTDGEEAFVQSLSSPTFDTAQIITCAEAFVALAHAACVYRSIATRSQGTFVVVRSLSHRRRHRRAPSSSFAAAVGKALVHSSSSFTLGTLRIIIKAEAFIALAIAANVRRSIAARHSCTSALVVVALTLVAVDVDVVVRRRRQSPVSPFIVAGITAHGIAIDSRTSH
jgi:hypothetical protein